MNIFYFRKKFFIFVFLLSVILIGFQFFDRDSKQDPLTSLSFQIFSEIQTASVNFHKSLSEVLKKYLFLLEVRQKNRVLEQENKQLKIKQQLFEEVLEENKRLKAIVNFPRDQNFQLLAGKVIGADFFSQNELLTINRGRFHGLRKGMGVLHPSGVVGYVFRVSPHSSQVITLLSPLSSLPVRNRNSRASGLLQLENSRLQFTFWKTDLFEDQIHKNFKAGSAVITMESDQFPAGFLAGRVLPFNPSSKNLNPEIYVQPSVDFNSLEEVFVILKSGRRE